MAGAAAGGDIMGQVAQGVGAVWSANRASRNARHAHRRFMEWYGSRYQRTVKDLEAAGLNPVLAVRGGMAGGSMPSAMAGSGPPNPGAGQRRNYGDVIRASARYNTEMELLRAQVQQAKAGARATTETADKTALERMVLEAVNAYLLSERGRAQAQSAQELNMGADQTGAAIRGGLPLFFLRRGHELGLTVHEALSRPGGISDLQDEASRARDAARERVMNAPAPWVRRWINKPRPSWRKKEKKK